MMIEAVANIGELLKREWRIVLKPKLDVLVGRKWGLVTFDRFSSGMSRCLVVGRQNVGNTNVVIKNSSTYMSTHLACFRAI